MTKKEKYGIFKLANKFAARYSTVNNAESVTYTYDQNGNITKIVYSTGEGKRVITRPILN